MVIKRSVKDGFTSGQNLRSVSSGGHRRALWRMLDFVGSKVNSKEFWDFQPNSIGRAAFCLSLVHADTLVSG